MSTYEFGIDSELSLPDELQVVELGAPAGDAIDDIQAATLEAVRSPLEFPPLKDIVVPGDRVTLALANELPRSATVIAAIIQELLDAGIERLHGQHIHSRSRFHRALLAGKGRQARRRRDTR